MEVVTGDEARELLGFGTPQGNSIGGGDTATDTNGDDFEVSVFAGATGGAGVGRGSNIEGGTVVGTTGAPGGQVRYAREPKAWENTQPTGIAAVTTAVRTWNWLQESYQLNAREVPQFVFVVHMLDRLPTTHAVKLRRSATLGARGLRTRDM